MRGWKVVINLWASALALVPASALAHRADTPTSLQPIAVVDSVRVGRHPLGVAIHSSRGQAIVANRNGRTITILDLATASVMTTVPVGRQPTDVAINPLTNVAVVSLAAEQAVALVSLNGFSVLGKVGVGHRPAGVAVDPGLNVAVIANQQSRSVSILDLSRNRVVAEVVVGRRPTDVAVNPLTHIAAVTNRGDGTVTLLDLSDPVNPTLAGVIRLPNAGHPARHDDDHGRRAHPVGVAFDYGPSLNRLVVADAGADAVHVVTLNIRQEPIGIATVGVGRTPMGVAVNPGQDWALVTSDRDDVYGVTLAKPALLGHADLGKRPRGVAIDPVSCRAVVTNRNSNTVSFLATSCAPRISALEPPTVAVGSTFRLTISGAGFGPGSRVNVGTLRGLVPASIVPETITIDLTAPPMPASIPISVTEGGQTSNVVALAVAEGLPPQLTALAPNPSIANGQSLVVRVSGQRLAPDARVYVAGWEVPRTTLAGCTVPACIAALLPAYESTGSALERLGLTLKGGSYPVYVENPDGARTGTLPLLLLNPAPALSTLVPNASTQGTEDKIVTIFGSGFVADTTGPAPVAISQVLFNGVPVPAEPYGQNPTMQLFATVPAAIMQAPGVYSVTVVNPTVGAPAQGGGASLAQPFTVTPATVGLGIKSVASGGHPVNVAAWRQGSRILAAAALNREGQLQLFDVTDPVNPALLGVPISLAPSLYNAIGDLSVNAMTRRVVATLPQTDQVAIVDVTNPAAPTAAYVDLAAGAFPIAVAVDPLQGRAVVANNGDVTVSVIDLATLQETATITLPSDAENPVAVAVNAVTGVAAVVDQRDPGDSVVYLINITTGALIDTITVGRGGSSIAINTVTNRAVVTNQDDNSVSIVDLTTRVVVAELPVGQQPVGAAIDEASNLALVSNLQNNEVTAINLATNAKKSLFIGILGVETPLDIVWVPDPSLGVAVCGTLIGSNLTVLGVPPGLLP